MYIVNLTVLSIVVCVVPNDPVHSLRSDVTIGKSDLFRISKKLKISFYITYDIIFIINFILPSSFGS